MTESYKILAQLAPSDTSEQVLYTSPSGTQTIITNITAVNRSSSSAQTFSLNVYNSVKTNGDFTATDSNSKFVAVAEGGSKAMYSTNGTTWTNGSGVYGYAAGRIAVGPAGFIVPPTGYNQNAQISTDGITWSLTTFTDYTGWWGAGFGNGTYVVAGDGLVNTSDDLVTWTKTLVADFNYSSIKAGVVYGQSKFVAAGSNGNVFTSPDGLTWTSRTSTWTNAQDMTSLAAGPSSFVAVGGKYGNTTEAMSSTDGITWTKRTLSAANRWNSVIYGAGRFVAVGNPGGNTAITSYSTDGITWATGTMPASSQWSSIAYNGVVFIAVNNTNSTTAAASSTDGLTWTLRTASDSALWNSTGGAVVTTPYSSPQVNNLYKSVKIQPSTAEILEPAIVLGAGNTLVVKGTANTTFSVYGVELS